MPDLPDPSASVADADWAGRSAPIISGPGFRLGAWAWDEFGLVTARQAGGGADRAGGSLTRSGLSRRFLLRSGLALATGPAGRGLTTLRASTDHAGRRLAVVRNGGSCPKTR